MSRRGGRGSWQRWRGRSGVRGHIERFRLEPFAYRRLAPIVAARRIPRWAAWRSSPGDGKGRIDSSQGGILGGFGVRAAIKRALGQVRSRRVGAGVTILTYHRMGGGSQDELDLDIAAFLNHVGVLASTDVVSLDEASRRLEAGDRSPCVVLTFDDGFSDIYENAWPVLRERRLPFALFLATRYIGGRMRWDGATAKSDGAALTWDQVAEFVDSGLCTLGNHTHSHVRPGELTTAELDACSDEIERHVGFRPRHFAYPWGIAVEHLEDELRQRFRTAATGVVGRNLPGQDPMRLRRVPVRRTDPLEFFHAKLTGQLLPERAYGAIVTTAKKAGARA